MAAEKKSSSKFWLIVAAGLGVAGYMFPNGLHVDRQSIADGVRKLLDSNAANTSPAGVDPLVQALQNPPEKTDFRPAIVAAAISKADRDALSSVVLNYASAFQVDQTRGDDRVAMDTATVMAGLADSIAYRFSGQDMNVKYPGLKAIATQFSAAIELDGETASDVGLLSANDAVAVNIRDALLDLAVQLTDPTKKPKKTV